MKLISVKDALKQIQTIGERHELDEIFAPVLLLQEIVGQQILDPNWSWQKILLKLTCILSLIFYVIVGTIEFMRETDDFILCSEAIFTLIIIFQFSFQVIPFMFSRSTFCEAYSLAKSSLYNLIEEVSPERSVYLKALLRNVTKVILFSIVTSTLSYIMPAMWSYFNGEMVNLSPSTSILMPMTSPTFEIGMMLHTIFFVIVATAIITVNMWFAVLIIFFCEACDCAVKMLKTEKAEVDDASYALSLNDTLKKFYSFHVVLMNYLSKLKLVYKWTLLASMITMYSTTCVFLLVLTQEINWKLAVVELLEFLEITAFNMLGEQIKTKVEDMRMAILYFDWMGLRLKDRKNYYIIICYMNKHFGIRTATGADLSLVTLLSIYKGSYQAYAVFNTMNR